MFEAVAGIVKRVQAIVDIASDRHGRNSLLTSYIQYTCTLPHPEVNQPCEYGQDFDSF